MASTGGRYTVMLGAHAQTGSCSGTVGSEAYLTFTLTATSDVFIATHVPLQGKTGLLPATVLQSKLAPYSSYVIGGWVARGTVHEALYWDTGDPYHYVRLQPAENSAYDYLIVGGEDHKTGHKDDAGERFVALRSALRTAHARVDFGKYPFLERGHVHVEKPAPPVDRLGRPADAAAVCVGESGARAAHVVRAENVAVFGRERHEHSEHAAHLVLLSRETSYRGRGRLKQGTGRPHGGASLPPGARTAAPRASPRRSRRPR